MKTNLRLNLRLPADFELQQVYFGIGNIENRKFILPDTQYFPFFRNISQMRDSGTTWVVMGSIRRLPSDEAF